MAKVSAENRLSYEIDWLGIPIIQTPEDITLIQELFFKSNQIILSKQGLPTGVRLFIMHHY